MSKIVIVTLEGLFQDLNCFRLSPENEESKFIRNVGKYRALHELVTGLNK